MLLLCSLADKVETLLLSIFSACIPSLVAIISSSMAVVSEICLRASSCASLTLTICPCTFLRRAMFSVDNKCLAASTDFFDEK